MSPLPQYAFDFTMDLSLHINADDNGNEGRYVNDCFGRMWEQGKVTQSSFLFFYFAVVCFTILSLRLIPVLRMRVI